MNNILLVGNGFDLAHRLKTGYKDFLKTIKEWDILEDIIFDVRQGRASVNIEVDSLYRNMAENNLKRFSFIIGDNWWVKYFCDCEAEMNGWIDFEREIYPVLDTFEEVFNSTDVILIPIDEVRTVAQVKVSSKARRIASFFGDFFEVLQDGVEINEMYVSYRYGILKKRILDSLKRSLDEFIEAFEIYLIEFVSKKEDIDVLKQIKDIKADYLISFNYTLTERLYGIKKENVHHIHGEIREDLTYKTRNSIIGKHEEEDDDISSRMNNMVLGVNEQENQNMDFIYFVKYFQRIQKASGTNYKKFVNRWSENEYGDIIPETYTLYIYGHSLDETDADILKYLIGNIRTINVTSSFEMKPEKVIIYYYDSTDYEQKVINLIKLYGRSIVEEYMEKRLFKFEQTKAD